MNNQVLIVDDHPAIRMSVRFLLEQEGYQIIGEVDNGVDALQLLHELQPGTLVLDIGLPKIDGLTIINRITAQRLPVKIIVLTAQESDHIAIRCMQAGAHGFVNKQDDLCELISAIQAVKGGFSYFPDRTFPLLRRDCSREADETLLNSLSARELKVLQQLTLGMSNKQIAERMNLSSKTISTYKTRLLIKLNASNLLDLYELARRNGLADT
jgi:two-component system response regulator EvgA